MGRRTGTASGAVGLLCALLLSACASGNLIEKAETDATIITGSVPATVVNTVDAEQASDEATIRNAISSVDLQQLGGAAIPWANPGTGSRGAISSVTEYREGGALCRRFVASRESYAGVGLFNGDACLQGGGYWRMRAFKAA